MKYQSELIILQSYKNIIKLTAIAIQNRRRRRSNTMQLLPKNISGRRTSNIVDSPSIDKHASGGGNSFRTKILKCVGRGRTDKTTTTTSPSEIYSSSSCAHDMIKRPKVIPSMKSSSTSSIARDFCTQSCLSLSDRTEDTELMMSSYSCNNNTIVHEEPQVHVRRLTSTEEEEDYECSSASSYRDSASYVSESSDDSSWSSEDEGEGYSSSDDDVSLSSMDPAELYESSNIQNMLQSASTSSKRRLQRYDDCLVPTRAEQQAYIDHIKASVAQEVAPPSPSIIKPPSGTDSSTVSDDSHQEVEVPICQECQEEVTFPDICCRHHPNIHLKKFSTTRNKWLTLFDVCPICEAHDDFKQQYDRRSMPCPPTSNEEEDESMTLHFVRCRI